MEVDRIMTLQNNRRPNCSGWRLPCCDDRLSVRAVRLLSLLAIIQLFAICRGSDEFYVTTSVEALLRSQPQRDRAGLGRGAVGPTESGRDNGANHHAILVAGLPIQLRRETLIIGTDGVVPSTGVGSSNVVLARSLNFNALPFQPLLLLNDGACLVLNGLVIRGVRLQQERDLISLLEKRLLHEASRGQVAFHDVIIEVDGCRDGLLDDRILAEVQYLAGPSATVDDSGSDDRSRPRSDSQATSGGSAASTSAGTRSSGSSSDSSSSSSSAGSWSGAESEEAEGKTGSGSRLQAAQQQEQRQQQHHSQQEHHAERRLRGRGSVHNTISAGHRDSSSAAAAGRAWSPARSWQGGPAHGVTLNGAVTSPRGPVHLVLRNTLLRCSGAAADPPSSPRVAAQPAETEQSGPGADARGGTATVATETMAPAARTASKMEDVAPGARTSLGRADDAEGGDCAARLVRVLSRSGALDGGDLPPQGRRVLAAISRHGGGRSRWGSSSSSGLAAGYGEEASGEHTARAAGRGGFGVGAQFMVAAMVLASVGGIWFRRLFSCVCASPAAPPQTQDSSTRPQHGARSFAKTSTPMARNSQNHTLSALSRFSAQLRKGEDGSVRDGSIRRGSVVLRQGGGDGSVRGGSRSLPPASAAAVVLAPPPLLRELSELKACGQSKLATTLQGIWQEQQRVVVKVLAHGEDCCFMLEQVGEVWSRLTHPNIVTCLAADTFEAACLTNIPEVASLLSKPTDTQLTMQTWIVLERCENGSLAALLAQRYQQRSGKARRDPTALVTAGGSCTTDAARDTSAARHLARRLGRFSRGRRRSSDPKDPGGAGPSSGTAVAAAAEAGGDNGSGQAGPAPAPTSLAAPAMPCEERTGPATPPGQPGLAARPRQQSMGIERAATGGLAGGVSGGGGGSTSAVVTTATAGSGGSGSGTEDGAEGASPGLLPVAEVLSIAHDIASGLAYLHSLDLCHGDLRAENVMVQTVVLPSQARGGGGEGAAAAAAGEPDAAGVVAGDAAGSPDGSGCDVAALDVTDLAYGNRGGGGGGEVPRRGVGGEEGLMGSVASTMYGGVGSNGGCSGMLDVGSGGAVGGGADGMMSYAGGGGGGGAAARHAHLSSNASSFANTANVSCAAADSCAHPWSSSFRQSTGYVSGSTYNSTATNATMMPQPPHAGGTGTGTGGGRHASVDDRGAVAGSMGLQTSGAWMTAPTHRAGGQMYGGSDTVPTAGRSQLGAAAAAAVVGVTGTAPAAPASSRALSAVVQPTAAALSAGDPGAQGGGQGHGESVSQSNFALSSSAIAALSRGIGLMGSGGGSRGGGAGHGSLAAAASGTSGLVGSPYGTRPSPFTRRQSNGSLSAHNTNSGNDVATMSKALSGLTAWPESPQEGRCLMDGGGPAAAGVTATNSVFANGGSGAAAAATAAAGLPAFSSIGSSNGSRCAGNGLGTSTASSALSPCRKPVIGGLKSALTAPESTLPPLPTLPPPAVPSATAERLSAFADPRVQAQGDQPGRSAYSAQGASAATRQVLTAARLPSDTGDALPCAPPTGPSGGAAAAAAAAVAGGLVSPHAISVNLDSPAASSTLASPRAGAGADDGPGSGRPPSTPTVGTPCNPSSPGPAPGSIPVDSTGSGRSRSAVGVVCTIAGNQNRRCSAPPVVSLPVIRRVAKLTDPWVALARMPADCAGGPWSPEAAEAIGATSGADLSHLPPELLLTGRLHPSSDVYSLGVLMWRMLSPTGEAPYAKLRPAEVAYKVVACGMRPAFSPAVPEALRRLVEDCWQSDPTARPTVQQVLLRLADLQGSASAMQRQWRDRHALFGAVSTVPISAVAVMPLAAEHNETASRWAEVAGIRLLRTSCSWGGSGGGPGSVAGNRGDLSAHTSFGRVSSRNHSGTCALMATTTTTTTTFGGSAAHLYQQPPPPTPPAGHLGLGRGVSQFVVTGELSNHSNAVSSDAAVGATRGSQSNHQPTSPLTGHLPVQPYRRGTGEPF